MTDQPSEDKLGMTEVRGILPAERDWLLTLNNKAVPHVNHLQRQSLDDLLKIACYARLALADDKPLGVLIALWPGAHYDSANYRWFSQRFRSFLYVDRILVADGARGQGIGQALYDDIERFAGECTTSIALEVNSLPPNPVSMRFHRAAGFVPVGELEHEGGAKKALMMLKSLNSPPHHPRNEP